MSSEDETESIFVGSTENCVDPAAKVIVLNDTCIKEKEQNSSGKENVYTRAMSSKLKKFINPTRCSSRLKNVGMSINSMKA